MTQAARVSGGARGRRESVEPHGRDGGVRRLSRLDDRDDERTATFGIDPATLPGRYTSKFDLSTAGGTSSVSRATRALGYVGRQPMISRRVVNDTAQTLTELEQRYPPP